jgi:hypothetical protein
VRLPSGRFLIGLVLVLVVCVVTAFVLTRDPAGPEGREATTVTCLGGSEKTELMADVDIRRLLKDKHGLTVAFNPLGSYDQVQLTKEDLAARGVDCLWPASASAQSVFEATHRGAYPEYRAETVLQSPEVIYAGPAGTDALIRAGLVQLRSDRYYLVNMKSLLLDYILKARTWESVGATKLIGPIAIQSTDPAKSNSGFTLAQLELNILATDDAFSAASLAQARGALPTLRAVYDAQGLQANSSEAGFRQWLTQGAELHSPLYAGYENQIIQLVNASGDGVLKEVRILYPDPTIYSDHPVLALNATAARFLEAMKDDEIQAIAWKRYGMRSSVKLGINNVGDFPAIGLAEQIRTTTPPNAEVTLALLACVKDAAQCV